MNQRIVWYRVNDTNIQTAGQGPLTTPGSSGTGNVLTVINGTGDGNDPAGKTVNLAATAPPTNRCSLLGPETLPEWPISIRQTRPWSCRTTPSR